MERPWFILLAHLARIALGCVFLVAGLLKVGDIHLYAEQIIPRKRAVQSEEVAHTVAFLLSSRSSGINAQRIVIDAGMGINYFDRDMVRRALSARGETE